MPVPSSANAIVASFLGNFNAGEKEKVTEFYETTLPGLVAPARELVIDFLGGLSDKPTEGELAQLADRVSDIRHEEERKEQIRKRNARRAAEKKALNAKAPGKASFPQRQPEYQHLRGFTAQGHFLYGKFPFTKHTMVNNPDTVLRGRAVSNTQNHLVVRITRATAKLDKEVRRYVYVAKPGNVAAKSSRVITPQDVVIIQGLVYGVPKHSLTRQLKIGQSILNARIKILEHDFGVASTEEFKRNAVVFLSELSTHTKNGSSSARKLNDYVSNAFESHVKVTSRQRTTTEEG